MKNLFISHFFIFSLILAGTSDFDKGLEHYKSRSESAVGYNVKSKPIDNAIKQFKKASIDMELDAGIYLMRSYYFKGKFVAKTEEEKKKVFSKGKDLGEKLIISYPESAAARYWFLVNLGSWSEVYGIFAAAKEGVANLMRDHAKIIIELDSEYSNGGGYFMLGAVHYKSPYIPFVLSWPENDKAIKYLTMAFDIGISTSSQTVYLARALYKDGQKDVARSTLLGLLKQPYSVNDKIEDFDQHQIAKNLLEQWK